MEPESGRPGARDRIQVYARIRPLGQEEEEPIVQAAGEKRLRLQRSGSGSSGFDSPALEYKFDCVLDGSAQHDVFERCRSVVRAFVEDDVPATLLAFGQTGSGKTYTMFGDMSDFNARRASRDEGVVPRALREVFALGVQGVECSCLEVYQDHVYDLLSVDRKPLEIRDQVGTVRVSGLQVVEVRTLEQAVQLLELAARHRTVAHNGLNAVSSRAHTVFQLAVSSRGKSARGSGSKLQLVDLAGSEKLSQQSPAPSSAVVSELTSINKSLSCLGLCVSVLCDRRSTHVPYRSSKLTRLLREALDSSIGQVVLVVCLSPSRRNFDETLSSLQFADRAKKAILCPRGKQPPGAAATGARRGDFQVEELQAEVARLSGQLLQEKSQRLELEVLLGLREAPKASELDDAARDEPRRDSTTDVGTGSSSGGRTWAPGSSSGASRDRRSPRVSTSRSSSADIGPADSVSEAHVNRKPGGAGGGAPSAAALTRRPEAPAPLREAKASAAPAAAEHLVASPSRPPRRFPGPLVSPSAAERPERHRPLVSDGLSSPAPVPSPQRQVYDANCGMCSPQRPESVPVCATCGTPHRGPRAVSPWGTRGPQAVFEALRGAPAADAQCWGIPEPLPPGQAWGDAQAVSPGQDAQWWQDAPLSPQAVASSLREMQRSHQREIAELANRAARAALLSAPAAPCTGETQRAGSPWHDHMSTTRAAQLSSGAK